MPDRSYWPDGVDPGPDAGHTFRLRVESRMSSTVVGDEHHTDAADFMGGEFVLDVRGFSLAEGLRAALDVPFSAWTHEESR